MEVALQQLVYFGFIQSVFILLVYLFSPRNRRNINGFLAMLIAILFVGLLGKVLHSAGAWGGNFRLIAMSEFSVLLFGPTVFLFTRSILQRKKYQHHDMVHYIPGIFYSLFMVVYFIVPTDAVLDARAATGELSRVIYACHAAGLIVNLTYWGLSWKVFRSFSADMRNEVSYELRTRFIVYFLRVIGFGLIVWTLLYLTSLSGLDMVERTARPYIWIILTLIILFIAYYGMVAPQVLRIAPKTNDKKYHQSKLSIKELELLKEQLDELMREKKPYLNNKLLKAELAQMFGINEPELARLLNEGVGMNFFEYVNYYRIKEFVSLAKTEKAKQLTFFGLAQEAGFKSKTTFNKSFKRLMGTSPTAYFDQNSDK